MTNSGVWDSQTGFGPLPFLYAGDRHKPSCNRGRILGMRLGVSTGFAHENPADWAGKQLEIGAEAVVFPVNSHAEPELIEAYRREAETAGLLIAEVGVWNNLLSKNPEERAANEAYAIRQLRLADQIGARCCVNIAGTFGGPKWDGGYKENFSEEAFRETVASVQRILDAAQPQNTDYTLEPMPWMLPTGPEDYLRLLEAVNREHFAVHLDLVNMINTPERFFFQEEFMEEVFTKLHGRIRSCHLKDIRLDDRFTFRLEEKKCGEGSLNLEYYAELASREDPEMPMLLEHIDSDAEYRESFLYVKNRLRGR